MIDRAKLAAIQLVLGVKPDGIWGIKSQAALEYAQGIREDPTPSPPNEVYASCFADPKAIEAFLECKNRGGTDQECFELGDNGVGIWGDSTARGTGPSCALPPEYIEAQWGRIGHAKHRQLKIQRIAGDARYEVIATLKHTMPRLQDLQTKARIYLNPDACEALGLHPPCLEKVGWWWMDPA
jgi:hypothetical protein